MQSRPPEPANRDFARDSAIPMHPDPGERSMKAIESPSGIEREGCDLVDGEHPALGAELASHFQRLAAANHVA